MIDYILDKKEKTIRGGFINALITFTFLILIICGIIDKEIRQGILALQHIMIWFFSASFGIWSVKKTVEYVVDAKSLKITDNTGTDTTSS